MHDMYSSMATIFFACTIITCVINYLIHVSVAFCFPHLKHSCNISTCVCVFLCYHDVTVTIVMTTGCLDVSTGSSECSAEGH